MTESALNARLRADARMNVVLPRLIEIRAAKARLDAEEARALAEAEAIAADWTDEAENGRVGSDAGFPYRSIAAEIGAALRVSDRTVQRQMNEASTLVNDYAGTLEALDAGAISAAHVRAIVTAGAIIETPEMRGGCQIVCVRGVCFLWKDDTDDHDRQRSSSGATATAGGRRQTAA